MPRFPDMAAAILAGGQGKRLGGLDKALLEIDGETILARQLRVLAPLVAEVAVVAPSPDRYADFGAELVVDPGGGPLDGLAAALAWSPAPWLLVVACDMPRIRAEVIAVLAAARAADVDVVAPRVAGRPQPLFALYRRELLPAVEARIAQERKRAVELLTLPPEGVHISWIDESALLAADPRLESFTNLNRPEDVLQIGKADRVE